MCMAVHRITYEHSACSVQKRMLESLEMKLEAVVSHPTWSWALSLGPLKSILCFYPLSLSPAQGWDLKG